MSGPRKDHMSVITQIAKGALASVLCPCPRLGKACLTLEPVPQRGQGF